MVQITITFASVIIMYQYLMANLRGETFRSQPRARVTMDPLSNICANFEQVGQAFATHYYNVFDTNRGQLGQLYKVPATPTHPDHEQL